MYLYIYYHSVFGFVVCFLFRLIQNKRIECEKFACKSRLIWVCLYFLMFTFLKKKWLSQIISSVSMELCVCEFLFNRSIPSDRINNLMWQVKRIQRFSLQFIIIHRSLFSGKRKSISQKNSGNVGVLLTLNFRHLNSFR